MPYLHHKYYPFSPVIPAGTLSTAPVTTQMPVEYGHMHAIEIDIPSGHNGLTGVKILYQQQEIVPWSNTAWLIGSGKNYRFSWEEEIMPTGLALQAYNTDLVPHQFFVRVDLTPHLNLPPAYTAAGSLLAGTDSATVAKVQALTG